MDSTLGSNRSVIDEVEPIAHEMQECLIAIRVALAAGDWMCLNEAAADLEERAEAVRANRLAELASSIKQSARAGEFAGAGWSFGQAVDAFVEVRARLLEQRGAV
jgi:HPt (histidine-containing phosphotransfer) domain-containing protein